MKYVSKIAVILFFLLCLVLSFRSGSYRKEREYQNVRIQRCERLILFAIDKTENHDLSDTGVMGVLISNLYAAHEFCDDPVIGAQLNDLWNTLIYRGDGLIDNQEALTGQLRGILASLREKTQ